MKLAKPRSVIGLMLITTALIAAAAVALANTSRSGPNLSVTPRATKALSAVQQRALHARLVAARRSRHRRAHAAASILAPNFAIFRRAATADDQAPDPQPGDDSRKAFTAPAMPARPAVDVFLIARGDQICVVGRGGSACGPATQAATTPVIFALVSTRGGGSELYGAASDDVTAVEITDSNGYRESVAPTNNAFAVDLPAAAQSVRMKHRDGTVVDVTR